MKRIIQLLIVCGVVAGWRWLSHQQEAMMTAHDAERRRMIEQAGKPTFVPAVVEHVYEGQPLPAAFARPPDSGRSVVDTPTSSGIGPKLQNRFAGRFSSESLNALGKRTMDDMQKRAACDRANENLRVLRDAAIDPSVNGVRSVGGDGKKLTSEQRAQARADNERIVAENCARLAY